MAVFHHGFEQIVVGPSLPASAAEGCMSHRNHSSFGNAACKTRGKKVSNFLAPPHPKQSKVYASFLHPRIFSSQHNYIEKRFLERRDALRTEHSVYLEFVQPRPGWTWGNIGKSKTRLSPSSHLPPPTSLTQSQGGRVAIWLKSHRPGTAKVKLLNLVPLAARD